MIKEPNDPLAEIIAFSVVGAIIAVIRFASGSISFKRMSDEKDIEEEKLKPSLPSEGREVDGTLCEIKLFLDANATACRAEALAGASELANDKEKTVCSIRDEKMKVDHLALLLITNTLGEQISSGAHHVHRGILGHTGRDMCHVFRSAVEAMKKRGYCTDEEAAKDMQWINEKIRKAG